MATPHEYCITNPSQLEKPGFAAGLSELLLADSPFDAGEKTQQPTLRLRLGLLQPLADSATFAACRNPSAKTGRQDLTDFTDSIDLEYIDISALDKAWRRAWAHAPRNISHITFDLSLPQPLDDRGVPHKVDWDTAGVLFVPKRAPTPAVVAVSTRETMRLVMGLANVTRMRVPGEVQFELRYDEAQGISPARELLKEQLKILAEAKRTSPVKEMSKEHIAG